MAQPALQHLLPRLGQLFRPEAVQLTVGRGDREQWQRHRPARHTRLQHHGAARARNALDLQLIGLAWRPWDQPGRFKRFRRRALTETMASKSALHDDALPLVTRDVDPAAAPAVSSLRFDRGCNGIRRLRRWKTPRLSTSQECADDPAPAPTVLTRCDVPGVSLLCENSPVAVHCAAPGAPDPTERPG
ncbi:hypothetical protein [Aphanothece microscopica]|uniref:hypothetical protein n=1 Tax=Aphanothece microscopica TaxID=1049561 RepID=UPI003CE5AA5A